MSRIRTKYLECGSAAAAFETKAAAALPHSKCSVEIVTVLPVLRQIKNDFFSEDRRSRAIAAFHKKYAALGETPALPGQLRFILRVALFRRQARTRHKLCAMLPSWLRHAPRQRGSLLLDIRSFQPGFQYSHRKSNRPVRLPG
jgi:hypothetical protein